MIKRPLVLKQTDRMAPVAGPLVEDVSARALVDGQWIPVSGITDGLGLRQHDADPLLEHDTDPNHMWVAPEGAKLEAIEFDLGTEVSLDLMLVWNYNEPNILGCGLRQARISVWTQQTGWQVVSPSFEFDIAEGTDDYDVPREFRFNGVRASKVRLDSLMNIDLGDRIGIAEVQFYKGKPENGLQAQFGRST
ncbi:MAG: hypothetical protein QHH07_06210 [Sedimentisphaerales bacterium]|nr:hypothetical protein [Sedimentisphaerales bacterium]